ncbi:MAG TPA: hypothetical protein DEA30_04770 [Acholeplasmataceae bacterium]|nr:hypothetical protein [Acholeplasmataceae bacterium]HBO67209.1 hypothetical protein [Acholeplasmataceae bacterium]HBS01183.1 hypothetical protein [Acholeplasmataceae bacterium]HCB20379.1 hypothetical protein [Acholeplasmataceae bacterium]
MNAECRNLMLKIPRDRNDEFENRT